MTAMHPLPLGSGSEHRLRDGARRTSFVVLGVWAAARLAETAFALWVRHAASSPPQDRSDSAGAITGSGDAGR